jgi:ATP-dependent exoDNAse (exonuclease V) beta subunit
MLEMLGDFTQDSLINAKDMMLNKYGGILTDIEVKDIVNRIEMLLKDRKFLELIEGTAYKEKALRYNNNLRYIDLLIHKPEDNYIVIDYKSSISYAQDHKKQVEYYVDAIKNITHKKTQGYICYLLENEIKIVISTI